MNNKKGLSYSQKLSIATLLFIPIALWSFHVNDNFGIILYGYGLAMYIMATTSYSEQIRKTLSIIIWSLFVISLATGYYANHNYPHGEYVDTGDVVCINDDRGPCHESYIEDVSNLDIPKWVKFFHTSAGELTWFALLFAGIIISNKLKIDQAVQD